MKVVLFCGGLGMRLREYSEAIPKPMVPIGSRPILWHLMRYYAFHGHRDFILCLGYRADVIKRYFLEYDETVSNDFVLTQGGKKVDLLGSDIQDWKITFVDTGLTSNLGTRLKMVQSLVQDEEMFLANYSDGVTDLPLPAMIDYFRARDAVACFAAVVPGQTFHMVRIEEGGLVTSIQHVRDIGMRVNGGFFVFRPELFEHMRPGEDMVEEPFQRLAAARKLIAYPHDGFWGCMDTFKDKQLLEDLYAQGHVPWEVWKADAHPR
ncbi:MAG: glucose-1-phosphate cytidylyltransferase [Deltaproteobacteria bacterium]|nr:glucose-1-phosphate cytidylyltransferase [Deltaproteobacteria bacterium]